MKRIAALGPLWRSVGFRLALHYALLVGITMLAALSIIYLQTVGVLHERLTRQVSVLAVQLADRFEHEGPAGAAQQIDRILADGRNSDDELLLLADTRGRRLAGNLDAFPGPGADGPRALQRKGERVQAWATVRALGGGDSEAPTHWLVVGQDLGSQHALESLIASASGGAALVTLLLLAGGVFLFRQELARSVGEVRRTAARIADGDLRERVALANGDDEFARLAQEFNHMLDRIQSLMDGVRHVSDTIAHNLRTPLTRILVRLHAAAGDAVEVGQRQAAIQGAIAELEEMARVFEKLLQVAELETGARRGAFGPVALHTVADDVVELYEAVAEARGATLARTPAEPLPVRGDRDLLAGVVANLLDNALKYGGPGCTVRVGTAWEGGQALLTVQDDGPGVAPEALARIGERFVRLRPEVSGHGLGLASVRAVVALHGGRIRCENAAPGLRVCIELPAGDR